MLSIRWTGQQELNHNRRWSIPSPVLLDAHIQEVHPLVQNPQFCLTRRHPHVALASRLEDGLNFDQLSLVVLHVLDELADGVVGAVDLVVLGGEGLEEEGGEGGGGDVLGGEAEDVFDFVARIELGLLSHLKRRVEFLSF